MQTIADMNGTESLPNVYDLRIKRIKKGSYGISGSLTVTDDFEGYEVCFRCE